MDLQELSKLTSLHFLQQAFSGKSDLLSCEKAIRATEPFCTSGVETAVRNATLIFETLKIRTPSLPIYDELGKILNMTQGERSVIAEAISHLRYDSMLPDLLEQMSIWMREMKAFFAYQLPQKKKRLSAGDVFDIPLFNGQYGYAQVINSNQINVLDRITSQPTTIDDLEASETRFGPIIVFYGEYVKCGVWVCIGKLKPRSGRSPGFVGRNYEREKDGQMYYGPWYEIRPESHIRIGRHLPERYRGYELDGNWPAYELEQRIITGRLGQLNELAFATESWFHQ